MASLLHMTIMPDAHHVDAGNLVANSDNPGLPGRSFHMSIVRLMVLGSFAYLIYLMLIEFGSSSSFGSLIACGGIVLILAVFLLPTIEVRIRKSRNPPAIASMNVLLGWGADLGLAFKHTFPVITASATEARACEYEKRKTDCPYCGEEILVCTVQCEHCLRGLR